MYILGIETSCDETGVAIMSSDGSILSEALFSQIEVHKKFGGVVPELASRDHATRIDSIVREAIKKANIDLKDISIVAISNGPGLLGCLLVGLSYAKAMAMSLNIPILPVDHVKAHLMTAFLPPHKLKFPLLGMVVSGGHTSIYLVESINSIKLLAKTIDDAAGECFDKVARYVGLPYPGGKELSMLASKGTPSIKFSKPKVDGYDFSFSGLKTKLINYLHNNKITLESPELADILASFEETITDILIDRMAKFIELYKVKAVAVTGGVAANRRLRQKLENLAKTKNIETQIPPIKYCTDNGVMVANYARLVGTKDTVFTKDMLKLSAYPTFRKK